MTFPFIGHFSASLLLQPANDSHNLSDLWEMIWHWTIFSLSVFQTIFYYCILAHETPQCLIYAFQKFMQISYLLIHFFLYSLWFGIMAFAFFYHLSKWLLEGRRKMKHLVYHTYHFKMVLFYFIAKAKHL